MCIPPFVVELVEQPREPGYDDIVRYHSGHGPDITWEYIAILKDTEHH